MIYLSDAHEVRGHDGEGANLVANSEKATAHKEPVEETDKTTKNEDSAKAEGSNMKADEVNSTATDHLQHVNIEGCAIDIKKVCIMVCMLLITNDLYLFMYYHICYESLKP